MKKTSSVFQIHHFSEDPPKMTISSQFVALFAFAQTSAKWKCSIYYNRNGKTTRQWLGGVQKEEVSKTTSFFKGDMGFISLKANKLKMCGARIGSPIAWLKLYGANTTSNAQL
ncbi:hypothetical protein CEXT_108461 [Caerostris extrusa]|uniref:LAGLIDADG homing endonuclease n=1 Tax=Caerostris extrusa TaxID=172846 RepID=A0AAV4SU09_CAEEX|nr:hypothetical protein CEXT_108461 [Caerostris extrusa]